MRILLLLSSLALLSSSAKAGANCEAAQKYVEKYKTQIKEIIKKRPDPSTNAYATIQLLGPYSEQMEKAQTKGAYYSPDSKQKIENLCFVNLQVLAKELNQY